MCTEQMDQIHPTFCHSRLNLATKAPCVASQNLDPAFHGAMFWWRSICVKCRSGSPEVVQKERDLADRFTAIRKWLGSPGGPMAFHSKSNATSVLHLKSRAMRPTCVATCVVFWALRHKRLCAGCCCVRLTSVRYVCLQPELLFNRQAKRTTTTQNLWKMPRCPSRYSVPLCIRPTK